MGANLSLNNHDRYFRLEAPTSRPLLKFHRHEYRRLHQENQHHRRKTNQALIGFAELKFLPLMPRCSSIVSSISLLDSNEDDAMDEYHEWKLGLERRFSFLQHCMRLLNISGGFQAGQITPPGFPSYTSTSRCMRPFSAGAKVQKKKQKQREQLYKDMNRAQHSFNIHDLISLRMSRRKIRTRRRIANENDSDDEGNSTSTSSDKNLLLKGSGRDPSKENKVISQKKIFNQHRNGEPHQKLQKDDCEEEGKEKEEDEAEYLELENEKDTQRDPAWKNYKKPHRRGLPTQYFKLDKLLTSVESTSRVSEEWGSGWTGTNFIVEIEETASATVTNSGYVNNSSQGIPTVTATINGTSVESGPKIIVRPEEVLIVGLVLALWVAAIVLFFNRWGKIRMLEPYQPKFQQQHRSSCALVDMDSLQSHPRASVSRMSMGMTNQVNMPTYQFATYNPSIYAKGYTSHSTSQSHSRPRQNSVFVGPSPTQFMMISRPPRKTRSAIDLHSATLEEAVEQV